MARIFPSSIAETWSEAALGTTIHANTSVVRLLHALRAPSDRPNIAGVLSNCSIALRAYCEATHDIAPDLASLLDDFTDLAREAGYHKDVMLEQPAALYRRKSKFPIWSLFSKATFASADKNWLEAAGSELAAALATNTQIREKVAVDLTSELRSREINRTAKQTPAFINLRRRLLQRSKRICTHRSAALSANDLRIAAYTMRIESHFVAKITRATRREMKSLGTIVEHSSLEAKATARELRIRAERGDIEAILYCMAFMLGLPLHLTCETPFTTTGTFKSSIAIDLSAGLIRSDLTEVITGASANYPGSKQASRIFARPLPEFLHAALHAAVNRVSSPKFLGDIDPTEEWKLSRRRVACVELPDAHIHPTLPRFIASRGSFAIQHGIDRAVAAYLTNDFTKIGHARHYYLHLEPEEIWHGARVLFNALDWGEPVAIESGPGYGSAVVPESALLVKRNALMCAELERLKPGRRYRIEALERHHLAYALFCADRTNLLIGGRAQGKFHFRASDFQVESDFLQLPDKRVGASAGFAPVSVPALLHEQIDLWFTHCYSLARRLERQGFTTSAPIFRHLQKVLAREPVALFFGFKGSHLTELGCSDVSTWFKFTDDLATKPDFGRHFWQNALRTSGLSSRDIDLFMRHTTSGQEALSIESALVLHEAFQRIISTQNRIVIELGLLPVAGLAKG